MTTRQAETRSADSSEETQGSSIPRDYRDKVLRTFLVPIDNKNFFSPLDVVIKSLTAQSSSIATAFRHNLQAILSTTTLPVQLAIASIQRTRLMQLELAERFRMRARRVGTDKDRSEETARDMAAIAKQAHRRLHDEMSDTAKREVLAESASRFLLSALPQESVSEASAELMRQGVVLTWGAFEVLVRDVFIATLNQKPNLTSRLLANPDSRRLFNLRGLDFEVLAEYEYNISARMGEVLASAHDIGNLGATKTVLNVLFENDSKLRKALSSKELWVLSQRRHLFVHHRAVVDSKYLKNTGEKHPVGDRLVVSPKYLERSLNLVRDVGICVLRSFLVSLRTDVGIPVTQTNFLGTGGKATKALLEERKKERAL